MSGEPMTVAFSEAICAVLDASEGGFSVRLTHAQARALADVALGRFESKEDAVSKWMQDQLAKKANELDTMKRERKLMVERDERAREVLEHFKERVDDEVEKRTIELSRKLAEMHLALESMKA